MNDSANQSARWQRQPGFDRPGARASGRRGAAGMAGMTILELMITLAVIGLIMFIGINAVRYVAGTALREDTTQIGQVLRAAHNMATTTARHHRVVFDLDKHAYRIEMCEGDIRLRFAERERILDPDEQTSADDIQRTLRDSSIPPEIAQAASPAEAAEMAAALTGSRVGDARCGPPVLPTGDRDGRGVQRQLDTESGMKIRRMFVQHLEDEQSSELVHVNFFPLGYAEKTLIEIGDERGNAYTVLVHAFTGRVEFRDGRVDEDEFMMRRADGERASERSKAK